MKIKYEAANQQVYEVATQFQPATRHLPSHKTAIVQNYVKQNAKCGTRVSFLLNSESQ